MQRSAFNIDLAWNFLGKIAITTTTTTIIIIDESKIYVDKKTRLNYYNKREKISLHLDATRNDS